MGKKLTEKEKLFVKYYPALKFNGTQAAIKAGYSKKTAGVIANENLRKPYIQEAIVKEVVEMNKRVDLTQEMVINELKKLGFSNISDYMKISPNGIEIKDLENIDTSCISEASETTTKDGGSIRIKLHNKEKALEMLGRYFNIFKEDNKVKIDFNNLTIKFSNIDFKKEGKNE